MLVKAQPSSLKISVGLVTACALLCSTDVLLRAQLGVARAGWWPASGRNNLVSSNEHCTQVDNVRNACQ